MSGAVRDYRLLWSAALASRDPRAKWVFRLLALGGPLAVGMLVWMKTGVLVETLAFAARVPVVVFMFAALTYFMPGAVRMNTPETARLVPRMRRRLMQLTILVWATSTAAVVLMVSDTMLPLSVVALATLTWLIGLGLSAGGYQTGALLQVAPLLAAVWRDQLPAVALSPTGAAIAALMLLALAARTLELIFPNGGERHWRRRGAQARAMARTRPEGLLRHVPAMRWSGRLYAGALRRACRQRRHPPAVLLALFGPVLHWSQRYMPLLILLLGAALFTGLFRLFGGMGPFNVKWLGVLCQSLLFAQLFTYGQRTLRLADTRAEQGLLRLAPSVPAAAARFNRQLNGSLLRMALLDWLAIVATLLAMSALAGAPAEALLLQAQAGCFTLPLLAANVRDHARHVRQAVLLLIGGLAASTAFSFGIAWLVQSLAGTPLLPVAAAASIVLALGVVALRWRAAVAAPYAFPAGRFA
ncbi:hypothetical protein [Massilia suwonensis]|uniref:ABC-2 type transport system permease protein n=1 Tax=Massilia suwonensis TaxID=648895 RepID=A0ABW0MFM4_9BURK